jgi:hypothetical protein
VVVRAVRGGECSWEVVQQQWRDERSEECASPSEGLGEGPGPVPPAQEGEHHRKQYGGTGVGLGYRFRTSRMHTIMKPSNEGKPLCMVVVLANQATMPQPVVRINASAKQKQTTNNCLNMDMIVTPCVYFSS